MGWLLALAPVAGLAANVAVQVAAFRLLPGRQLLRSVVVGFAAGLLVTAAAVAVGDPDRPLPDTIAGGLLAVLTTAALGYGYFHFVNLGETARRVRILTEFAEAGGRLTVADLLARYNAAGVVRVRLDRLLSKGQVVRTGDRLAVGKPTVLRMARTITALKQLVLGKTSEFDPG